MKFRYRVLCVVLLVFVINLYMLSNYMKTSSVTTLNYDDVTKQSCASFSELEADVNTFSLLEEASKLIAIDHINGNDGEKFPDKSKFPEKETNEHLTVFAVPHSHNDPAWMKTFDGYWEDQSSTIMNNILLFLKKWPDMTFMWTETVFLDKWWTELDAKDKLFVAHLIKSGRLEIAGGGWVAPDEAVTTLYGLVDNLMQGHGWLEENLEGVKPTTWWNLDPFGYSTVGSFITQKAGYKHSTILRVNTYMKDIMRCKQNLEFDWMPFWLPRKAPMFTSIMPYRLYNFKYSCGPDTNVCLKYDFRKIPGESSESMAETVTDRNVYYLAELLVDQLRTTARLKRHNAVIMLLGDDFRYDLKLEWEQQYANFKRLFDVINAKSKWNMDIKFGTPSDYFKEMEKQTYDKSIVYPSLSGDFYTYTDMDYGFWSGYFTTRPHLKWLSRDLQHHLRMAEIFVSFYVMHTSKKPQQSIIDNLEISRRVHSFFQHHDSITGTSTQYVTQWYALELMKGVISAEDVIAKMMKLLLGLKTAPKPATRSLYSIDDAYYTFSKSKWNIIYLTNSVTQSRKDCVRYKVHSNYVVMSVIEDGLHFPLTCQLNPAYEGGSISSNLFEIVACLDFPALGFRKIGFLYGKSTVEDFIKANPKYSPCSVALLVTNERFINTPWTFTKLQRDKPIKIQSYNFEATFRSSTGMLQSIVYHDKKVVPVDVNFYTYDSKNGGVYIFDATSDAKQDAFYKRSNILFLSGPLMSSVIVFQNVFNHTATIYHTPGHLGSVIHFKNRVDLHNPRFNFINKELIVRISTDISSLDTFYTDANSLLMIKRRRLSNLSLAANYYPITNAAMIEDTSTRLTLLTNHAHGVTSQSPGELEVVLHRYATNDDQRGNSEGIHEDFAASSNMYLIVEPTQSGNMEVKNGKFLSIFASLASRFLNYPPTSMFGDHINDITTHAASFYEPISFLPDKVVLPCNIEVTSMRSNVNSAKPLSVTFVIQNHGNDCTSTIHLQSCARSVTFNLNQILSKNHKCSSTASLTTLTGSKTLNSIPLDTNLDISPGDFNFYKVNIV